MTAQSDQANILFKIDKIITDDMGVELVKAGLGGNRMSAVTYTVRWPTSTDRTRGIPDFLSRLDNATYGRTNKKIRTH